MQLVIEEWKFIFKKMKKVAFGKIKVGTHIYPITSPCCIFGSGDECDIRIANASQKHCQIEFNPEREAFLRCFGPNVTVNRKPVANVTLLMDVSEITIGSSKVLFLKQIERQKKRLKPEIEAQMFVKAECDPDDLYERLINQHIGRGVFAGKDIESGKFLVQYYGVLSKADEVQEKDTNYTYFFKHKGSSFCVDATKEPTTAFEPLLGRLVNHADTKQERNSKMAVIVVEEMPCLALFATRKIRKDEEIRYDYGISDLPWKENKTESTMDSAKFIPEKEKLVVKENTNETTKTANVRVGKEKHVGQQLVDTSKGNETIASTKVMHGIEKSVGKAFVDVDKAIKVFHDENERQREQPPSDEDQVSNETESDYCYDSDEDQKNAETSSISSPSSDSDIEVTIASTKVMHVIEKSVGKAFVGVDNAIKATDSAEVMHGIEKSVGKAFVNVGKGKKAIKMHGIKKSVGKAFVGDDKENKTRNHLGRKMIQVRRQALPHSYL